MAALLLPLTSAARGQSSSLGRLAAESAGPAAHAPMMAMPAAAMPNSSAREAPLHQGNPLLEGNSLFAVKAAPPKQFRPNDLITIIVRQEKRFEAESELEQRKAFEIQSTLDAFVKLTGGGIGASQFRRGKPNIDYELESRVRNKGDNSRDDLFVTRISGTIVDVKPNGNLVLQARSNIRHEEEVAEVRLTGICRSADVSPDNTILSTQLADLRIDVQNAGAVKDTATRGWLTRALDFLKPI